MLEENSKILRWVVDKVPFLGDIECFRTESVGYFEDIFLEYKTEEADHPIPCEQSSLEKKLKTETQVTPKNREQSKHWSKQLDSPLEDTKLDFCGEKMKWA